MSDATNAQRTDAPIVLSNLTIGSVVERHSAGSEGQHKGVVTGEPHLRTVSHGHQIMVVNVTPLDVNGEKQTNQESWLVTDLGVRWAATDQHGVSRASC